MLHHGIVIQSHMPYKHKCTILDRRLGMIECLFNKQPVMQRVHHGMFIEYSLVEEQTSRGVLYRLDTITILATPQPWAAEDLDFLHHFLELVRHFVVFSQPNTRVFEVIMMLFKPNPLIDNPHLFKKWLLCHFFVSLGIYPENHDSFDNQLISLISSPGQTMVKIDQNDILKEAEFSRWLVGCIAYHPQCDLLKTVSFLTRMDSDEA